MGRVCIEGLGPNEEMHVLGIVMMMFSVCTDPVVLSWVTEEEEGNSDWFDDCLLEVGI